MPLFSPLVEHAIEFAAEWHDGTYRKGRWRQPAFEGPPDTPLRVPVMAHLTAVATTVQRAGWGESTVAAAFLHDAVEDENRHGHQLAPAVLEEHFGAEVTEIVLGVTEQKRDAEGHPRSWQQRKDDYVRHLRTGHPAAAAISLADKLHNLWTMNESLAQDLDVFTSTQTRRGLSAGPEAQQWFHRAVLEASEAHPDPRLGPMRARLVQEIERFEALADL